MTIRTRVIGPGKQGSKPAAFSETARRKMTQAFKDLLSRNRDNGQFFLQGKRIGHIVADFKRAGKSAALVIWVQPGEIRKFDPKAVSVLMGTADDVGDKRAMAALRRLGQQLTYPASVYEEIETDPRPCCATLHFDRPSYESGLFAVAAECFAAAFFEPPAGESPASPRPARTRRS